MENGREARKDNDLFFTCALIDYIARKTKNTREDVVNALGKKRLEKIYDLADIYHSDNIDRVSEDFIEEAQIKQGNFDNVGECQYAIPTQVIFLFSLLFSIKMVSHLHFYALATFRLRIPVLTVIIETWVLP